ncbi:MAG: hypothetical protein P8079_03930 [Gammaproteobacteria bacterium]
MGEARRLARDYRLTTGKPLAASARDWPCTTPVVCWTWKRCRPPAVGRGRRAGKRIRSKGHAIFDEALGGQRIGQLKTEQEWDSVMLGLMEENYEPVEIYEAECEDVMEAVDKGLQQAWGGIRWRNSKVIGQLVWSREKGRGR